MIRWNLNDINKCLKNLDFFYFVSKFLKISYFLDLFFIMCSLIYIYTVEVIIKFYNDIFRNKLNTKALIK